MLVFFARSAGAVSVSCGCGSGCRRRFTKRSQITGDTIAGVTGFGFFRPVFSYLAVYLVPVRFFAVHDVVDLRAQVVEEFLFFLLWGGDYRRRRGFLGFFAFLLKFGELVEGSVEDAG